MAYWKKYLILLTPFVVPFLLSGSLERLIAFLIIFLILPLCCMSGRSKVAFQTFPTTSDAARVALSEARIQAKPSFKQAVAHLERFIVYCKERSLEMGFEAVACFLTNFMKENKDHTASLSNVASHLRTQHDLNDLPWLTAKEEKRLKKLLAQYRLEDTTPVDRKSPLRTKIVTRAIDKWNLDNVWELQWATLLLVAVQVLLRTKEVMGGLRASHFIWKDDGRSVVINLGPTKTYQRGDGQFVELGDEALAFKFLQKLFKVRNLHKNPDEFVFCMVRDRKLYPTIKASEKSFRSLIKSTVASIGLNPVLYSGHSCRAGGATDLFAAGIPYYVVKKYGRWASDAALIYYRCEYSIAQQAAAAFQV